MLDSNSLYVKDENGNEKRMTILFTFDNEVTKKQYVVSKTQNKMKMKSMLQLMMKMDSYCQLKPMKNGKW